MGNAGCIFFAILTTTASAVAQVQRLDVHFDGVNCVPCLESLPVRAMRVRGVESASVDPEAGILKLKMMRANRVRVEQFRDLIEQDGTKARKVVLIEVQGTVADGGKLAVPQTALPFFLEDAKNLPAIGTPIRVTGIIENLKPAVGEAMRIRVTQHSVLR